jgi:hypothetical protein
MKIDISSQQNRMMIAVLVAVLVVFGGLSSLTGNMRRVGNHELGIAIAYRISWIAFSLALFGLLGLIAWNTYLWLTRRRSKRMEG